MRMNRRVVITGMGIWSCLGTNQNCVAEALRQGKSGIGLDQKRIWLSICSYWYCRASTTQTVSQASSSS